jgi:hypothetical protein
MLRWAWKGDLMKWRAWITYNIRCRELFLVQVRIKIKLHIIAFPQLHM